MILTFALMILCIFNSHEAMMDKCTNMNVFQRKFGYYAKLDLGQD